MRRLNVTSFIVEGIHCQSSFYCEGEREERRTSGEGGKEGGTGRTEGRIKEGAGVEKLQQRKEGREEEKIGR